MGLVVSTFKVTGNFLLFFCDEHALKSECLRRASILIYDGAVLVSHFLCHDKGLNLAEHVDSAGLSL